MNAAQKNELIKSYAKTYITESDRGNSFGALNAKYQCCVVFYLCEKAKFDRVVTKIRNEEKDSQYRFENGTLYELRGDAYICCFKSRSKSKRTAIRQYERA
jgi:hypothetical protein